MMNLVKAVEDYFVEVANSAVDSAVDFIDVASCVSSHPLNTKLMQLKYDSIKSQENYKKSLSGNCSTSLHAYNLRLHLEADQKYEYALREHMTHSSNHLHA